MATFPTLAITLGLLLTVSLGADALRCYSSNNGQDFEEECGMHTGCIKKFYPKTQKVVEKGCFLANTNGTSCFVEDNTGLGVCLCTTNLCNAANTNFKLSYATILLPMLHYVFTNKGF